MNAKGEVGKPLTFSKIQQISAFGHHVVIAKVITHHIHKSLEL